MNLHGFRMKNGMKKLAVLALMALFSSFSPAAEPMATMKYVTNQINRLDKRIDGSAIPPGYGIVSNKAMTAVQPGDKISTLTNDLRFVDETITNGFITAFEAKSYIDGKVDGKRERSDMLVYKQGPAFDLSPIESVQTNGRPFTVAAGFNGGTPPQYSWLLVDKDGTVSKSANTYDNLDALLLAESAVFGYSGETYEISRIGNKDYERLWVGAGDAEGDYSKEGYGTLTTEERLNSVAQETYQSAYDDSKSYVDGKFDEVKPIDEEKAREVANDVVTSKGYATETFVTGGYYDKDTVDQKIAAATPDDYANVKSKALSAVQTEVDPNVPDWAYGKDKKKPSYNASEVGAYSTGDVDTKVANLQAQIEAMTAFEMKEVDRLPDDPKPGIIYLVPDPDSPGDKISWIWVVDATTGDGKWVRVGSTKVNLNDYAKKAKDLEGYGITNAYTKNETDFVATNAAKYKSTVRATTRIGRFVPDEVSGYVDIDVDGMTIQEALEYIASERLLPSEPTLPKILSVSLAGAGAKEVGTTFSPSFSIKTDLGAYTYGPKPTGSTFDLLITKDTYGRVATNTASGTFPSFTVTDSTSYKVEVKGHFTQGYVPKDNTGKNVTNENLRIQAMWWDGRGDEVSADVMPSTTVTGYRQWFVRVDDSLPTINSTYVWGSTQKGNAKAASSIAELAIPAGTKRVMVAIPKAYNISAEYKKALTKVIDIDGMGLNIFGSFAKSELEVVAKTASAPATTYTIWVFENPAGIAATRFNLVIENVNPPTMLKRDAVSARTSPEGYQDVNNLNNNLNRQNAGPLDVSQLFYSTADFDYYRTKGRLTVGVSEYWLSKVPYPYQGQLVSISSEAGPKVYYLKENALGEYDGIAVLDGGDLNRKADKVSDLELVLKTEQASGYTTQTTDVVRVGFSSANAQRVLIGAGQDIAPNNSTYAVAVGPYAVVDGPWQVAVGKGAEVRGTSSIALGFNAKANDGSVAIGYGVNANEIGAVCISARNDELNNGGAYPGVDLTAVPHGFGSVNFNPYGGTMGFWIGSENLFTYLKQAELDANLYTDWRISEIKPESSFKVPSGLYETATPILAIYNKESDISSILDGCFLTNATFTAATGYPSSAKIRLLGSFAGRTFSGEEYTLVGTGDGYAVCQTTSGSAIYDIKFRYPVIPDDTVAILARGTVSVSNRTTRANATTYVYGDLRVLTNLVDNVDEKPIATHGRSLITSKAVAEVAESVRGKLSKSGDTATGDFTFDDYSEVDGWILPSFGWSGAKSYQVGTASKDGVTYEGGIGVGVSEPFKSNVKFPVSFRIRKQAGNEIREVNYTEDGVSEGSMTMMPQTNMEYRTVSFQRDEDRKLRAGTFALDEDYSELPGIVQGILDNGATKVQNKLAFKTSAAATADLASFDGSSELKVVKGENMKFTTDASSLTLDVDTNKVATVDFAKAVVPTWVATPDSETRFVTRMSGDGRRQKKRPIYKVKYGSTEYEFNLSHMTKFEVDEGGAVESMQFVNGDRVLDFQYGYVFYFWPDYRSHDRYYYVGKERGPYFSDDAYMAPVGGLTADTWLTQTGCDGGWYNAGSILDDTLSADDYWELDGRIDETAQGAHDELVAVSNSLMLVRSDRIYNMGKTGRFARYRVTRQQFGNTYVFDFELRADNKRDVSTGTWYDGILIEQRQGGTPESLTFRMIAYNGTYAGNYAFYISIDGNAETTEKMPLPTELFPMAVGETKNLGVMTVQKLSQGDQVVDSYLYGDLTVRKTQDDSIKDRIPTSSEFDFSGDLFRPLTSADDVERMKTVINAVIEKLKAVGQIEKGN